MTRPTPINLLWRPALHTVGYQGRELPDLITLLVDGNVTRVYDVRLNNTSRRPEFRGPNLDHALNLAGIEYQHLPELGNPKDNRDGLRRRDTTAKETYETILDAPPATRALTTIAEAVTRCSGFAGGGEWIGKDTIALLCYEATWYECHRALIGQKIEDGTTTGIHGIEVTHI